MFEYVADLEIGETSNQLIHMVCKNLDGKLETFAFKGENLTYSGVIGLSLAKKSLKNLSIRNPKCLTKYSVKLLASQLTLLKTLRCVQNNFKNLTKSQWEILTIFGS